MGIRPPSNAVVSECSFCTFPDKPSAAAEMARVLCPGGRLGLTDMTVRGPLPEEIEGLLAWVACVAGVGAAEEYVAILQASGFGDFAVEDQRDALLDMVSEVRRKPFGIELAVGLGKLHLGDLDLQESKRLAHQVVALIGDGTVGYTLLTARKGQWRFWE